MSGTAGTPGLQCLFCGRSTALRRGGIRPRLSSYELTEDYMAENPHVREYSYHRLGAWEIRPFDRICRPCVQRAERYYSRAREQEFLFRMAGAVSFVSEPPFGVLAIGPMSDPLRGASPPNPQEMPYEVPIIEPPEDLKKSVPKVELQGAAKPRSLEIPVPGFSRVSHTSIYCVVAQCQTRDGLHRINAAVRAGILRKHSIYIPAGVRVCNEHLNSDVIWQDFQDYTRSRHETFNSVQVADMVKLLLRPIDALEGLQ